MLQNLRSCKDKKVGLCDEEQKVKLEKRKTILTKISEFTRDDKLPCLVERDVLDLFSDEEMSMLVNELVDAGYCILLANGYFCIEVPDKRSANLYVKDEKLKDKYVTMGFTVYDLE